MQTIVLPLFNTVNQVENSDNSDVHMLLLRLALVTVIAALGIRQLEPFLKHLQVYQVARAQFLRPFTVATDGVIWPRYTNQLGNNLFQ
eukprot:1148283-Amorphochlora_amoeboformis.AAC.1